jgi:hypothetical protein
MTYLEIASENLFGNSTCVCIKQTFYTKSKNIQEFSAMEPMTLKQNIPHNQIRQAKGLTMEITCLIWALLNLVYDFVYKHLKDWDAKPLFSIPVMSMLTIKPGSQ